MKRLSALDGVTLHAETGTMPTHAGGILLLEPHAEGVTMTADELLQLLGERLQGTPSFRKRLVAKPFGLGQPVWADDPKFDVWSHLHRQTLPGPGSRRELAQLIGRLHDRRQDRSRPLWDAWVIDGFADGRLGVLILLSHAMTDGVGGITSILPQLMTTDPDAELPPLVHHPAGKMPNPVDLLGDMVVELTGNGVTTAKVALKATPTLLTGAARAALQPVRKLLSGGPPHLDSAMSQQASDDSPRTALNKPITRRRSIAFATVSMDDLRSIAATHDVTINDIFLTAVTTSVRRWLEVHDTVPTAPLRTLMPINTRAGDDEASNSFSIGLVKLPVQVADPVEQLKSIHAATHRLKGARKSAPAVDMGDVLKVVPPVIIESFANLYTWQKLSRFHTPLAHMVTSNIPGPAGEVYLAGAHVSGMFAVPPLFEGANLNITATSHGKVFDISVISCPDNIKDVESMAGGLEEAVRELRG